MIIFKLFFNKINNSNIKKCARGLSLLEALLTMTIVTIAVSVVLPVSKIYIVSQREETLKKNLYDIRAAIDAFHSSEVVLNYPESIDELLENRYLRRIDPEPFGNRWQYKRETGVHEWKDFVVSIMTDKPYLASVNYLSMKTQTYTELVDEEVKTYNEKIFDIRSSTDYTGINGIPYNQW
ncbi:MAG: hypothetical protein BWY32_03791 [bacterium ADurb.Bin243]|nr:MAG: hypothetical protein BWY32_03791 [bacterium ADurb.Bin243]